MHNRIASGKLGGSQRRGGIPLHFTLACRPPDQGNDLVTVLSQGASHRRSDQSRSTADEYTHKSFSCND